MSKFQPSLRDLAQFAQKPGIEMPGYCQMFPRNNALNSVSRGDILQKTACGDARPTF